MQLISIIRNNRAILTRNRITQLLFIFKVSFIRSGAFETAYKRLESKGKKPRDKVNRVDAIGLLELSLGLFVERQLHEVPFSGGRRLQGKAVFEKLPLQLVLLGSIEVLDFD